MVRLWEELALACLDRMGWDGDGSSRLDLT
jgi:hypothetical protein